MFLKEEKEPAREMRNRTTSDVLFNKMKSKSKPLGKKMTWQKQQANLNELAIPFLGSKSRDRKTGSQKKLNIMLIPILFITAKPETTHYPSTCE